MAPVCSTKGSSIARALICVGPCITLAVVWICTDPLHNKIQSSYRLGDAVGGYLFNSVGCANLRVQYSRDYPGSIATEYVQSTCSSKNWNLLSMIVNRRSSPARVSDAVIHIRLGDVAERSNIQSVWKATKKCTSVFPTASRVPDCWYIRSALFFKTVVIPALVARNVTFVLFVGSSRHCVLWARHACQSRNSDWYRVKVTRLFEQAGFGVSWSWNQPPDPDFLIMATARVFVQSGGGFSSSAAHCVSINNGTVIK